MYPQTAYTLKEAIRVLRQDLTVLEEVNSARTGRTYLAVVPRDMINAVLMHLPAGPVALDQSVFAEAEEFAETLCALSLEDRRSMINSMSSTPLQFSASEAYIKFNDAGLDVYDDGDDDDRNPEYHPPRNGISQCFDCSMRDQGIHNVPNALAFRSWSTPQNAHEPPWNAEPVMQLPCGLYICNNVDGKYWLFDEPSRRRLLLDWPEDADVHNILVDDYGNIINYTGSDIAYGLCSWTLKYATIQVY